MTEKATYELSHALCLRKDLQYAVDHAFRLIKVGATRSRPNLDSPRQCHLPKRLMSMSLVLYIHTCVHRRP